MFNTGNILQNTINEIVEKEIANNQLEIINQKYAFPANFKAAKIHKNAVKFGYNSNNANKDHKDNQTFKQLPSKSDVGQTEQYQKSQLVQKPKVCPCCYLPINTKRVRLSYHTTDVLSQKSPYKLDSSTSMFFSFLKMVIVYLLIHFLLTDLFNIVTSMLGNYCYKNTLECEGNYFGMFSNYNKYQDSDIEPLNYVLDILNLIMIVCSIVFFLSYRKIQYQIYDDIDKQHQTQDDYTLFIQNIPILDFKEGYNLKDKKKIEFDYEIQLKNKIQQQINKWIDWMQDQTTQFQEGTIQYDFTGGVTPSELRRQNIVTTISLCFDLSQIQKINNQREDLMQKQIKKYADNIQGGVDNDGDDQLSNPANQIKFLNSMQVETCQKFAVDNTPIFNVSHFLGKAFVSFEYQHYRQHLLQKYQENHNYLKYNQSDQHGLKISRASKPQDIFWSNMRITDQQRRKRVIVSFLILVMVLIFATFALAGTDILKFENIKENANVFDAKQQAINMALTILISIFTLLVNYGISIVIDGLTKYQQHKTRTLEQSSLIVKMLSSQFINTAFIYYLISVIKWRPLMSPAGLVLQVSSLIVVSGVIQIIVNFANIPYLTRTGMLWWYYKYWSYKDIKNKKINTFQVTLNKAYQLPIFDFSQRYTYYLLQVYTAMFYSYLVPIGIPMVALIFLAQYWIDKYNLFFMSSSYYDLGYYLTRSVLKIFEFSLLIFALGNLFFSIIVHDNHLNFINIISVIVSLLYCCFIAFAPFVLQRKLFGKYETYETMTYSQCLQKNKFKTTYWRQNPGTMFVKEVDINDSKKFVNQCEEDSYLGYEDNQAQVFIQQLAQQQLPQSINGQEYHPVQGEGEYGR